MKNSDSWRPGWEAPEPRPPARRRRLKAPARPVRCLLALALPLALAGCGLVTRTKTAFGGKLPIEVEVAAGANQNSPVAVDLVIVRKKKLLDPLLDTTAGDWFAGEREQFLRDQPQGHEVWSWEWVPGYRGELEIPLKAGAKAGVLFADYFAEGNHRMRIDPRQPIRLLLGEESFTIEPLKR